MTRLFAGYRVENLTMPVDREQFLRDAKKFIVQQVPPEDRLEGLTPEQRVAGLPPEKRLEGLSPEQVVRTLTPEQREQMRRLLDDPSS